MPVTRDPDLVPQVAELFQAYSRASNGSDTEHVMQAAANFLIGSMIAHGQAVGADGDGIVAMARDFGDALPALILNQLMRTPQPDDVPVALRAN